MVVDGNIILHDSSTKEVICSQELNDLVKLAMEKHPYDQIFLFEIETEYDSDIHSRKTGPSHIWAIELEKDLGYHWHYVNTGLGTEAYQCHRYQITYYCPMHNHSKTAISHTYY